MFDLPNHTSSGILIGGDRVHEPLYAIVPYFNPWRWKSREKHTQRALKHFHDSGATVIFVEASFNRRDAVFADCGLDGAATHCPVVGADSRFRHRYLHVATKSELWLKECLINYGVIHGVPADGQNLCWLDSDITFLRPDWVGECIQKLQHGGTHDMTFLQMFSQARDLAPNYEMLPNGYKHSSGPSFMANYYEKTLSPEVLADLKKIGSDLQQLQTDFAKLEEDVADTYPPPVWPGLAWACTRNAWDAVGGLFDVAIWGGGDYDMAHALTEQAGRRIHKGVHPNYRQMLLAWEDRCRRYIRRNVLVMEGVVFHSWHGRKTDRLYIEKRKLMQKVKFDPIAHLKRDAQGMWQLHDDGSEQFIHFRDMMRKIATIRNEDSIDL
jgi:hypothetical protein